MTQAIRIEAEAIFHELANEPAERHSYLLELRCGSRNELREEVLRLLAATDDRMGDFMRFAPAPVMASPSRIGRYLIERLLGEGGMGLVYSARQEHPDRVVALKVLRPGLLSPESLRRFHHEVEALAAFQHPGIANIFEAGTAKISLGGAQIEQPFFAMELIDGEPLTAYAQKHRLDTRARLELFAKVCDAVQHAHQKGVVHRDLKPGNILVDRAGQPKILDFGVARAANRAPEVTMATVPGQLIGTLAYMSPEQVAGEAHQVDTRSDVYSLGAVLFELLSGALPHEISGVPILEAIRKIREEPTRRLSSLRRELRGDLETICDKALSKTPDRRFASAAELAADVRHYLRHEPITARPASLLYQLSRFARRRRGVVIGASLILIATLGGAAAAGAQALRASRAERLARTVNTFLNEDLLAQANPFNEPDRDIKLRTVIDRAAERLHGRFADDPLAECAIRQTIGVTYRALGELDKAAEHLTSALEVALRELGPDDRRTIRLQLELGHLRRNQNRVDEAERLWRTAASSAERVLGTNEHETLEARSNLVLVALQRNQLEEAEAAGREILAIRRRVLGDDHGATLVSMNILGSTLERQGKLEEAEALFAECVERSRRSKGDEHPDSLVAISNLGLFYSRMDRFAEAEPLSREVLETRRRVLGAEHEMTLGALNNVGYLYSMQGRYAECEPYYVETYQIRRKRLGVEHPDTLLSMNNLGWLYTHMERWDEAEQIISEMVDVSRRVQANTLDLGLCLQTMGGFYVRRGRALDAEPLLREAMANFAQHMPPGDWRRGAAQSVYGRCLMQLDRMDEAEEMMLAGYALQVQKLGPKHQQTRKAVEALVELYRKLDRSEEADEWAATLQQ